MLYEYQPATVRRLQVTEDIRHNSVGKISDVDSVDAANVSSKCSDVATVLKSYVKIK